MTPGGIAWFSLMWPFRGRRNERTWLSLHDLCFPDFKAIHSSSEVWHGSKLRDQVWGHIRTFNSSSKGSGYAGPCRLPGGSSHQLGEPLVQVALGGGGSFVQDIETWIRLAIYVFFVALVIGSFWSFKIGEMMMYKFFFLISKIWDILVPDHLEETWDQEPALRFRTTLSLRSA